jgi:hypothetical protein
MISKLRPSNDRGRTLRAGRSHAVAKRVMLTLQENKRLFASFSSEKEDSSLFLKKKNQENFYSCSAVTCEF